MTKIENLKVDDVVRKFGHLDLGFVRLPAGRQGFRYSSFEFFEDYGGLE